jgi:cephalosporin hydroxylase
MSRFRRLRRRLRHLRRRAYRTVLRRRSYSPESKTAIVDGFHRLYYNEGVASQGTWKNTYWLGTPVCKCPLDLWVFQEILVAVRPDIIIETGTGLGGSAVFMACICDILQNGQVVTIDVRDRPNRPAHDRVTYLHGSSTAPEIRAEVGSIVRQHPDSPTVMVLLDAAHDAEHVLEELRIYHPLVSPGSYLIVEDTNVNSHPGRAWIRPGPDRGDRNVPVGERRLLRRYRHGEVPPDVQPGGFFLKRRRGAAGDAAGRPGRGLVADGPR